MIGTLEIGANGLTALAILLAGRNSVHTWWTGIVGCSLFALLFFQAKLYADVLLQAFYVVTSVLGWWKWVRGRAALRCRSRTPISPACFGPSRSGSPRRWSTAPCCTPNWLRGNAEKRLNYSC